MEKRAADKNTNNRKYCKYPNLNLRFCVNIVQQQCHSATETFRYKWQYLLACFVLFIPRSSIFDGKHFTSSATVISVTEIDQRYYFGYHRKRGTHTSKAKGTAIEYNEDIRIVLQ